MRTIYQLQNQYIDLAHVQRVSTIISHTYKANHPIGQSHCDTGSCKAWFQVHFILNKDPLTFEYGSGMLQYEIVHKVERKMLGCSYTASNDYKGKEKYIEALNAHPEAFAGLNAFYKVYNDFMEAWKNSESAT